MKCVKKSFLLNIGTPAQRNFFAALDLFERDLLVIDHKCGLQRTDCARYCKDILFFTIFCPPACDPARSEITRSQYCGGRTHRFWAENSTTFVERNPAKKWRFQSQDYGESTGRWVTDTIGFQAPDYPTTVSVPNVRFVLLEYTDSRLFNLVYTSVDVLVGLAPGPTAFVPQLFEHGLIAEATITIVPTSRYASLALIGQKANDSLCDDTAWKFLRPPDETNWSP
ncbi:hypothetical protein M3Y99_01046200 [Aphelenchoides fujianensis]|nr:hypothetical protein M3Y99_01046200 [Aphelenchoides fujianensis]